ncbi:methionine ABC transporter permease [Butyrivibrio proteoclasticus]|uniref:methionine ABC transporter permease n=1 Tax=Butyrivibrio proteoclasticus TaxID=43305 RepID=UPI0006865F35|nr:methionine ABC transporter permease [Butyrivibrio proteoclasticus]
MGVFTPFFDQYGFIFEEFGKTMIMVFASAFFSVVIGFIPAIILTLTAPDGLKPNKIVYEVLSFIINLFRSFPFIILLVVIIPFTQFVAGTYLGVKGVIVPLTVSAIPFIARIFETSLRETDHGVIEAAKSFGASNFQIIMRVYIKESIPRMLNGIVLLIISLVGYSAMAGDVGGGGIGDVAIRFGFRMYNPQILFICSVILIIFVQGVQMLGNYMYKKLR